MKTNPPSRQLPGAALTALLAVLALLVVPAAAGAAEGAAITPTRTASDITGALANPSAPVVGSSFVALPPTGNPDAISDAPLTGFPLDGGSYAILTTGDATLASTPNDSTSSGANDGGGNVRGTTDFDVSILKVDLQVPANANCLSFGVRFLSEEYDEYVGKGFNDSFVAELDTSDWAPASDGSVTAPHNFAFDQNGKPLSVNTAGFSADQAAGTTYDGATPLLRASTPITPGAHSLYLSIFDQGDGSYDSAAFLDDLTVGQKTAGQCQAGAVQAPLVTLDQPAIGATLGTSTPALSGQAGTAPGDASTVTVNVYAGSTATGTPVETRTVPVSGGAWSLTSDSLPDGVYTAQAVQSNSAGKTGSSNAHTFTLDTGDHVAPTPRITTPKAGQSLTDTKPLISGTAGTAGGDSNVVSVALYRGSTVSSTTTWSGNVDVSNGTFRVFTSPLAFGTYTAVVRQRDASGNVGTSPPVTFTVDPPGGADLQVSVTSTMPVLVGKPLTYTVTLHNHGPADATDAELNAVLPAGADLPANAAVATVPSGCLRAGRDVKCAAGHLAAGATRTYEFTVIPRRAGSMKATVAASAAQSDPVTSSNDGEANVAAVPPPKLTKSIVAARVKGTVRYRRPGAKRFKNLGTEASVPVGSLVDATKGRVRITSARDAKGHVQTADFYSGEFLLKQRRANHGLTTLLLRGSNFSGCPAPSKQANAAAVGKKRKRKRRSLWGSGKGSFRTGGRYGSATVRGTIWFTQDNCRSTFFKTARGVVSVRDYVKGKTVAVPKGRSYTVRAPKK